MATVTKDFKIKSGLVVEGANGTINGSDIITEDIITGGTQTNIAVTYNPSTKTLDFVAENGVADSTTSDLAEGTNLYFTDERAQDAVGNSVGQGLVYEDSTGSIKANINSFAGAIGTNANGWLEVKTDESTIWTGGSANQLMVKTGPDSPVASKLYVSDSINALTTSDIEEGNNLYFTNQRAIDAIGGSATPSNIANTVVKRDLNGNFAAEDITANSVIVDRVDFTNGAGSIDVGSLGMNIYAAAGDVNLGAQQGQVKIGGSQVTTTDNAQTLTNKTIGDTLTFNDGSANSSIDVNGNDLSINANTNLTLNTWNGDITLNPDGYAYISSTTESNRIATQGYVDNAVSGLNWKQAVNLLVTTPITDLSNAAGTYDGHDITGNNVGYRLLLTGQLSPAENGIYDVTAVSGNVVLVRSADADTVAELEGAAVFVMEGTQYNATSWVQSNHYAATFADLTWTQFSGSGNYTAGFGINLVGREFSADTAEMATTQALGNAVANLTDYVDGFLNSNDGTVIGYIDAQDAATLLAANGYSDTLVAAGNPTAQPTYQAIDINSVAKQVAATVDAPTYGVHTAYTWNATAYRSAEFLVKVAHSTHTEISKVLLTLDTADNVAITEYGIVGTNGSLSSISASVMGAVASLDVSTIQNNSTVTVVGTLLQ